MPRDKQTLGHPDYYSDDERDFLVAIQRFKEKNRCPCPSWVEVLEVYKKLGYKKVEEEVDLPKYRVDRIHLTESKG